MESFDYKSPVRIRFGNGELGELGAEISRLGCRRVLMVFNKGPFRENGLYEEVRANIAAKGIAVLGMGDIDSNPRLASVREGAQACRREKADGVVAVGGGSAMDCSKVIAAAALSPRDPWEHIWGPKAPFTQSLPTVFVPTIAATGTETNPWAVIFDEENRWKNAVNASCLYAKLVLADPQVMRTVPPRLTVWGAMDILSHTFEFYFNGYHRSIFQNRFSEAIIHSVMECLDILNGDPQDLRARGELWWASVMTWGGLTWLGREAPDMACHDLAEGFVPFYDTHHGATLGAITPRWMRFLVERGGGKIVEIFSRFAQTIFGVRAVDPAAAARQGVEAYVHWLKKVGAPDSLVELTGTPVSEGELARIVAKTYQDLGRAVGRLRPLRQEEALSILQESCRPL